MFRYATTFLVIFLVVNHDFAAARSVEFAPQMVEIRQQRDVFEKTEEAKFFDVNETAVEDHSRQKRSAGSLFRAGLALGSGAAFALSVGTTIYHAIRKCKDYRPNNCGDSPRCHYVTPCPNICHGPSTLRNYVENTRTALKGQLTQMDNIQRDAFNLATQAISAGLNNERILGQIDRINQKVNELVFSLARMDINLATKFRNNSVAIGSLIRNQLLSLDEIVSSQELDGIFDKWTWEGTGVFVLSLALPLSLRTYTFLKQRYAINEIYKNLKIDFEARFVNQKSSKLNPNARIKNKFAYVQDLSTKQINKQLRSTAKAIYHSDRAHVQVSKVERITNNYITPLVNAIVIALSVWTTYQQISSCQAIANDMHNTAKKMAEKADEVEQISQTQVMPLLTNVTTQAWPSVREMMTNQTTLDWLDEIRNLTLGANNPNATTATVIKDFIDNIGSANYATFLKLQQQLIISLKTIGFQYSCLADKQHAITTVMIDCRSGRQPFSELYQYATTKHKLNRAGCIKDGVIPYTTESQFFTILNATAHHQGWYSNCLLNNEVLRDLVCAAKIQGFNTPADIVSHVNKTGLTEDMVPNFLGRCPPPKITPKKITDTCKQYCLYQSVKSISKTVILLESQVMQIQQTCPICDVKTKDLNKICNLYHCQSQNATTIEKDVELPLPTVNFVLANNCSKGCVIDDPRIKRVICNDYKCKDRTVTQIAKDVGVPEPGVRNTIPECASTVCVVSIEDKTKVLNLRCRGNFNAMQMKTFGLVSLPLAVIQQIIDSQTCKDFLDNGAKP